MNCGINFSYELAVQSFRVHKSPNAELVTYLLTVLSLPSHNQCRYASMCKKCTAKERNTEVLICSLQASVAALREHVLQIHRSTAVAAATAARLSSPPHSPASLFICPPPSVLSEDNKLVPRFSTAEERGKLDVAKGQERLHETKNYITRQHQRLIEQMQKCESLQADNDALKKSLWQLNRSQHQHHPHPHHHDHHQMDDNLEEGTPSRALSSRSSSPFRSSSSADRIRYERGVNSRPRSPLRSASTGVSVPRHRIYGRSASPRSSSSTSTGTFGRGVNGRSRSPFGLEAVGLESRLRTIPCGTTTSVPLGCASVVERSRESHRRAHSPPQLAAPLEAQTDVKLREVTRSSRFDSPCRAARKPPLEGGSPSGVRSGSGGSSSSLCSIPSAGRMRYERGVNSRPRSPLRSVSAGV